MNEIESAKEPIREPPKEAPKSPQTPKEPEIQKFYKLFGLMQKIFLGAIPILGLISYLLHNKLDSISPPVCCAARTMSAESLKIEKAFVTVDRITSFLFLIGLLTSILSIIIGITIFFINRQDKIKRSYGKKFIVRGVVVLILFFVIYFIISITSHLFGIDISCSCLPTF